MNIEEKTYLESFEARVKESVLLPVIELNGDFILTDDISSQWERMQQDYIADAVTQIADYPEVSVAWAAYLGLAVAEGWDRDWEKLSQSPYTSFYGQQGFDDMDDNILMNHLGLALDSDEAQRYVSLFRTCAKIVTNSIRREQIPPQSPLAYHCFVIVCRLMFNLGASLRLKHLGYSLQKVDL
jgi:hypothetical protein